MTNQQILDLMADQIDREMASALEDVKRYEKDIKRYADLSWGIAPLKTAIAEYEKAIAKLEKAEASYTWFNNARDVHEGKFDHLQ